MRSIVLLSAGLDSSVNLHEAARVSDVVLALTFDYGQRAAKRELYFAKKLCRKLKIKHHSIDLKWMLDFGGSALIDRDLKVPTNEVRIDNLRISKQTAKSVWVPNRNGILLNIAAGYAESLNADWIIPGFNAEEAATFKDNSVGFIESLNESFKFSTANAVKVKCFTSHLNKTEIIKRGLELKINFENIWPCYFDALKPCQQCESCKRFIRAAKLNHIATKWMKNEI